MGTWISNSGSVGEIVGITLVVVKAFLDGSISISSGMDLNARMLLVFILSKYESNQFIFKQQPKTIGNKFVFYTINLNVFEIPPDTENDIIWRSIPISTWLRASVRMLLLSMSLFDIRRIFAQQMIIDINTFVNHFIKVWYRQFYVLSRIAPNCLYNS